MYERENLMNPISRSGWTVGSRVPSWTWQTRLTNKQQLLDLDASEREMWASVHAECVRKAFLMAGALLKVLIIQKFTRICSVIQLFQHIRNAARYREEEQMGRASLFQDTNGFVIKTHTVTWQRAAGKQSSWHQRYQMCRAQGQVMGLWSQSAIFPQILLQSI